MNQEYVRLETEEDKRFYQPPARLTEDVTPEMGRFLTLLRERSADYRPVSGWKVGADDLRGAAQVLAEAAKEAFGALLSLDDEDPTHLDAFVNTYLIAPELRPLFDGARVREGLTDKEYDQFAKLLQQATIPAEESLYLLRANRL